jgi:CRP/FNR family cyclic AMP-dependent transcriptional regulator
MEDLNARIDALKRCLLFRNLSFAQLELVASAVEPMKFAAGDAVVAENSFGNTLYVVVEGQVSVVKSIKDKEVMLTTLGPGDYFGEVSLLDNNPRSATVRCDGPGVQLTMKKGAFDALIETDPRLGVRLLYALNRAFCQRLRTADQKIVDLCT